MSAQVVDFESRKVLADLPDDQLVEINCTEEDIIKVIPQVWSALERANRPEPRYFLFGDRPARRTEAGIETMTPDRMKHTLARAARWFRYSTGASKTTVIPPQWVVSDMLATPVEEVPLPSLLGIVRAPTFTASGELHWHPGYDARSKLILELSNDLVGASFEIASVPSEDERQRALRMWLDVVHDFPFVDQSSRAHALAMAWLPFLREMVDGPTPMHLVEKPTAGSGATLLTEVLLYPALRDDIPGLIQPGLPDEWNWTLAAALANAPAALWLDNIDSSRTLDSAALARAITSRMFQARRVGKGETPPFPVRCVWLATANNPRMTTELTRRMIPIRLDPGMSHPWLRDGSGYKIPNLKEHVREKRAELIRGALTIVRGWIADGRPAPSTRRLGMFEEWSDVMGGILESVGVEGFLVNLESSYARADQETEHLAAFVGRWWDHFRDKAVTSHVLKNLICPAGEWVTKLGAESLPIDLGGTEHQQSTKLGKLVASLADRVFTVEGGPSVAIRRAGTRQRARLWRLDEVR